MKLLEINNLKIYFYENYNFFKAVDGVSFSIKEGDFFALIGESGSGKTTVSGSPTAARELLNSIVKIC